MTRTLRTLALALVALLAFTATASAAPAMKPDTPDAAARKVRVVMNLVRTQFLDPVGEGEMVSGALEGLKKALLERKRDTAYLGAVGAGADQGSATRFFDRSFTAAASRNPDLLSDGTLTRAAIDGVVGKLDDPHTSFLSSAEYRKLLEGLGGGSFGGVGVYISTDEKTGELICVEAMPDGPAARAGVRSRDVIVAIDGVPVAEMSLEDAKNKLRGEPGSVVRLTLRRASSPEPVMATVTREIVKVESVTARVEESAGHKIGYVRVRMFGMNTGAEFNAALDSLDQQGVEAYVVDLRNNGGGYIVAAVDLLSQFTTTSTRLVSVAERGVPEKVYASKGGKRKALPLALLVNDKSASASEITAGAVQDLHLGTLVGVRTYGKGSVQKIIPMADLTALKLTTAHYHTPSGKDIHKVGITPDVVVEMPAEDIGTENDTQMAKALEIVLGKLAAVPAGAR